jgi:3-oxoacyl-[acyl-carrier-protein] synthase II
MPRSVVVTGVGIVSPLGQSASEHFDALLAGKCGIAAITAFAVGDFPVKLAGEVRDFKGNKFLKNRKAIKMMARDIQLSVAAASLAARDARIYDGVKDPTRLGVSMGAGLIPTELDELGAAVAVSVDDHKRFDLRKFGKEGLANLFPLWLLKYLPNMLNSHIAIECDAQGPNNCITAGNASGLLAIGEAARVIERGDADLMLAGAAETKIHPLSLARLYLAGKLSTAADLAESGTRPFGRNRSGFAASEGAAALVLEEESHAKARGAKVYARLAGFGSSCGANLVEEIDADGRAAVESMRSALADARLSGADISAVFADASGLAEDAFEAAAIARALGPGRTVTATRGATGHMMSASGAADAAVAAMSIDRGALPGIIGPREPDTPGVEVLYGAREAPIAAAMVNAFTFGGQTASIVFTRHG